MPATTIPCPECGNDAQQIKTETVHNMVEPSWNPEIEDNVRYRICKTQGYLGIYSTSKLNQQFEIVAIRHRPNFKPEDDTESSPLCYCFGNNKEHLQKDIAENGETNIANWITEHMQAEECVCRWKSLLGGCCLGNVRAAITEVKEAYRSE